jgi:hypothetical protein
MAMDNDNRSEIVEVVTRKSNPLNQWTPKIGSETTELLNHLEIPENSKITLRAEAISILAKCAPPSASSGNDTGLVVGYVQAAKRCRLPLLQPLPVITTTHGHRHSWNIHTPCRSIH